MPGMPTRTPIVIATVSACQACGEKFYGFGYAGEPCSAECATVLDARNPDKH